MPDFGDFRSEEHRCPKRHCGFVINRDHATAADIMELMRQVQIRVKENSGVDLEPEVKRLGDE